MFSKLTPSPEDPVTEDALRETLRRHAPTFVDTDAGWAALSHKLTAQSGAAPHAEDLTWSEGPRRRAGRRTMRGHAATPRGFSGVAALAAVLVLALVSAAIFALHGKPAHPPVSGTPTATIPRNTLLACRITGTELLESNGGAGSGGSRMSGLNGQRIAVDGSSALQPLFAQAAAEFDTANKTQTTVNAGGSGQGLKDVQSGAVQIGMSDVFAQEKDTTPPQYTDLTDHQVAVEAFTPIVNNDLSGTIGNLTRVQIRQIMSGQVTDWSELGGPAEPITPIVDARTQLARATFGKYVLKGYFWQVGDLAARSTATLASEVKATPGSISFVPTSYALAQPNDVTPLCLDGYKASVTDIDAGYYPFWTIAHAYTKGPAEGATKALLQYVLSAEAQRNDLANVNFIPITGISGTAIAAHTPTDAPVPEMLH